jgi:signal transduction histidine kinase
VPVTGPNGAAGVFVAAHHSAEQLRQIEGAIQVMVALSIVAFLLATFLAWGVAGRAIAPLRELTTAARGIGERDLAARIPVAGTDEVAELTRTLNSMLARLEAAFGSQRDFLNDVGHELRTPITIIRGHLELLDADEDPSERQKTMALVLDELDRMGRYVSDLLLIARAEQPDFLRPAPLELAEFVNGLATRVRPLGDRTWSVVPPRPTVIVADADRLTQAMVNLAVNAVRHTPPGAVIELGATVEHGHARLWVRDEGTGIAPADQERIFGRFARGRDRVTGGSDGTGLGLAIVDAIAMAHDGYMSLDSEVGRGSTFSLVIPLEVVPS